MIKIEQGDMYAMSIVKYFVANIIMNYELTIHSDISNLQVKTSNNRLPDQEIIVSLEKKMI